MGGFQLCDFSCGFNGRPGSHLREILPQNGMISTLVWAGVQDIVLHMEVSHVYLAVHQDPQKCCDLGTYHCVALSGIT